MNLHDYFEGSNGVGVLATSNASGNVDAAIYAKPYIIDENIIAFLDRDGSKDRHLLVAGCKYY